MNPIEKIIYHQRSLSPDVAEVKPDQLRLWLQEIERNWQKIPELKSEPDN